MTRSKETRKPSRASRVREEAIRRLRGEVARLRDKVRALREELGRGSRPATNSRGADTAGALSLPPLPAPDETGNYPAAETLRAILARQLVHRRQRAGWTQAELAE